MSGYENVVGGKLKLKGKALDVKSAGMKKKKKQKKLIDQVSQITEEKVEAGQSTEESVIPHDDEDVANDSAVNNEGKAPSYEDHMTPAEKRYIEQRERIDLHRMAKDNNHDGDWTFVKPRKNRRNSRKVDTIEKQEICSSTDTVCDPQRVSELMQKMESCLTKLQNSNFYEEFLTQIQQHNFVERINKVLASELEMPMVIYGIGSIENYESPRLQLSLALLIKRNSRWIGEIEVFDPVLNGTESRVIELLGCSVLKINEQGRRRAERPMLFFMPHCEAELYNNVLQANWGVGLNRVVVFGNSFGVYQFMAELNTRIVDSSSCVVAVKDFTDEFVVKIVGDEYYAAFHDSSWHFFSPALELEELQLLNK